MGGFASAADPLRGDRGVAMTAMVWLLDDDHGVRFVLAAALRDAGLVVREFADAAAVRQALAQSQPTLLLTDVRLPGEGGLQLLAEWRERALGPVIVMSAYTDVATTAAAYRAGAFDYLAKPFDLDHAVAAVQRALASAVDRCTGRRGDQAGQPGLASAKAHRCASCSASSAGWLRAISTC